MINNTIETIKMHRITLTGTGTQHKGTRTKLGDIQYVMPSKG